MLKCVNNVKYVNVEDANNVKYVNYINNVTYLK